MLLGAGGTSQSTTELLKDKKLKKLNVVSLVDGKLNLEKSSKDHFFMIAPTVSLSSRFKFDYRLVQSDFKILKKYLNSNRVPSASLQNNFASTYQDSKLLLKLNGIKYGISKDDVLFKVEQKRSKALVKIPGSFQNPSLLVSAVSIVPIKIKQKLTSKKVSLSSSINSTPWSDCLLLEIARNKRNLKLKVIKSYLLKSSTDSIPDNSIPSGVTLVPLPLASPTPVVRSSIWQPRPGTSWQWQLSGTIDTGLNVAMYDLDLFDTPKSIIDGLKASGKIVICYFSAGTYEDWRSDADSFPTAILGDSNGWPGEKWLDVSKMAVLEPIMRKRLDLAKQKGCDGVEPDNVDGYANQTGFNISFGHQLTFNKFIASESHKRGLSVGLKNDLDQVNQLVSFFDWALNEQCHQYDECHLLLPFIQAGKAVFGVEYSGDQAQICSDMNALNMDWLIKDINLGSSRIACR